MSIQKVVAMYLRQVLSTEKSSDGENFSVVKIHPDGNAPYQDETLAIDGQEYDLNFEEDKDGISAETLEA